MISKKNGYGLVIVIVTVEVSRRTILSLLRLTLVASAIKNVQSATQHSRPQRPRSRRAIRGRLGKSMLSIHNLGNAIISKV